jgi:hypothetical protein
MGKVVLDGSEDWWAGTSYLADENGNTVYSRFYTNNTFGVKPNGILYSDKLPFSYYAKDMCIFVNSSTGSYPNGIQLQLPVSLVPNDNWTVFKQWLQANPTTVVYELAEPYYEEISPTQEDLIITSVKEGDLHIDTIVPISSKVTYNVNVQLLTDFEQSIVEQVQATQTTDLQSILDEEIDN